MKDGGLASATDIAVAALTFLSTDDVLMQRFLALSGIRADQIRSAAREPGFLAGVLQFIVAHEPTLMAFSNESGIPPRSIEAAARDLTGGDDEWDRQP